MYVRCIAPLLTFGGKLRKRQGIDGTQEALPRKILEKGTNLRWHWTLSLLTWFEDAMPTAFGAAMPCAVLNAYPKYGSRAVAVGHQLLLEDIVRTSLSELRRDGRAPVKRMWQRFAQATRRNIIDRSSIFSSSTDTVSNSFDTQAGIQPNAAVYHVQSIRHCLH
eukprot:symbB.v1.2.016242.t1/scaffold1233.1/size237523/4